MAMSDGRMKVWFHNSEVLGWIAPEYDVQFVNGK
jgi:hypothetical protein